MAVDIAGVLLGAFAGAGATALAQAIGFYPKRYLSGELRREQASLLRDYAQIAVALKDKGLKLEEVRNIGKLIEAREIEEEKKLASDVSRMSTYWTQAAMNERAAGTAEIADATLSLLVKELSNLISPEEETFFAKAQRAWLLFRMRQTRFAGEQFSGGTMAPLIRSSEFEALTNQRIASLKADVDQRKQQQGI